VECWSNGPVILKRMNHSPIVGPSPTPSAEPLEWHFSQVFGERTPGEEVQEGDSHVSHLALSLPMRLFQGGEGGEGGCLGLAPRGIDEAC
jgi:hypothetical protein